MDMDNDALSKMVHAEAKKSGISAKDARKAVKKLKSKGMMAQVAPKLQSQFRELDPNRTNRDKIRDRLRELRSERTNKVAKAQSYERTKQRVYEQREKDKVEKENAKKRAAQRRRNHAKKIRNLEKQIGTVTHEMYNMCMKRLQEDSYEEEGIRNRDRNIVELYGKQQTFSSKVDMEDIDDI